MFVVHFMDHPYRYAPPARTTLSLDDHLAFVGGLR